MVLFKPRTYMSTNTRPFISAIDPGDIVPSLTCCMSAASNISLQPELDQDCPRPFACSSNARSIIVACGAASKPLFSSRDRV